jgi:hypothetical protein
MGSAVVCRAVLMFELAGMRNALKYESPQEEYSLVRVSQTMLPSDHEILWFLLYDCLKDVPTKYPSQLAAPIRYE